MVRVELFTPQADVVTADTYNKLFTFHGIVMVWFFMVPAIPATLGNLLLPLMIGAPDVAFPRLNLFSWYLNIGGASLTLYALLVGGAKAALLWGKVAEGYTPEDRGRVAINNR